MKRFSGHDEPWGEFIDIKEFPPIKNPQQYAGKSIFLGSVTDGYNPFEFDYRKTRQILEQFVGVDAEVTISTKSDLVVRDIELLQQLSNVTVAFSINTMDEEFRKDMDSAATINERLNAMETLHQSGIHTATFISPIFPKVTSVEAIVEATNQYCDVYWLENLNLMGSYKTDILDYISEKYPEHMKTYRDIYLQDDKAYWIELSEHLETYARDNNINMVNYFYHNLIRKS